MPTFKVLVHGRGLVVRRWWFFRRQYGFYVTRVVDADDANHAAERAIESVRGEPRLALAAMRAPTLTVDEVQPFQGPAAGWQEIGIIFYPVR
jgi:hypothetical protein